MIIPKEDPIFITLCLILFILVIISVFGNKKPPYIEESDVKGKKFKSQFLDSNILSSIYNN